jgi:hypothetical protein
VRNFDAPRERPAPTAYEAQTLDGRTVSIPIVGTSLIVAVKGDCDGCHTLLSAPEGSFGDVAVHFVATVASDEAAWRTSVPPVVVAPSLLEALDVRWPPFWVLIDAESQRVLTEGVPFGVEHVASALAPYL